MILDVTRIPNSWEYEIPGFGKAHIETATLGANKGKLFLISEDYKRVAEINVLEKHMVEFKFGGVIDRKVNVADKIEIVRDNLEYKEVFFEVARKTKFAIEDGTEYEGYTYNRYWNGWDMPMFTKEIAEKILKELTDETDDWQAKYDNETDTFIFKYIDDEMEETEQGHDILSENGNVYHVYDIGAASWIWSEVEESEEDEDGED